MKQGLGSLGVEEVKAIAHQLRVKPEEVIEMETRMGGKDIALEPAGDDDEDSYAPIAYLADTSEGPAEHLERGQSERLQSEGLARALESLPDQNAARHHAGADELQRARVGCRKFDG